MKLKRHCVDGSMSLKMDSGRIRMESNSEFTFYHILIQIQIGYKSYWIYTVDTQKWHQVNLAWHGCSDRSCPVVSPARAIPVWPVGLTSSPPRVWVESRGPSVFRVARASLRAKNSPSYKYEGPRSVEAITQLIKYFIQLLSPNPSFSNPFAFLASLDDVQGRSEWPADLRATLWHAISDGVLPRWCS
jgi:hypothetical protein